MFLDTAIIDDQLTAVIRKLPMSHRNPVDGFRRQSVRRAHRELRIAVFKTHLQEAVAEKQIPFHNTDRVSALRQNLAPVTDGVTVSVENRIHQKPWRPHFAILLWNPIKETRFPPESALGKTTDEQVPLAVRKQEHVIAASSEPDESPLPEIADGFPRHS